MSDFFIARTKAGVYLTCMHCPDERFCVDCLEGMMKREDNKDARIRELEGKINQACLHCSNKTFDFDVHICRECDSKHLQKALKSAEEKVAVAREALKWYADETMYKIFPSAHPEKESPAEMDEGDRAREAIARLDDLQGKP